MQLSFKINFSRVTNCAKLRHLSPFLVSSSPKYIVTPPHAASFLTALYSLQDGLQNLSFVQPMINNFAATKSTKLFLFNSSELGVEMYNTLFVNFPSVSMFLICPCSTDSAGIANQYAKLFHCSLFLEVQEFNFVNEQWLRVDSHCEGHLCRTR